VPSASVELAYGNGEAVLGVSAGADSAQRSPQPFWRTVGGDSPPALTGRQADFQITRDLAGLLDKAGYRQDGPTLRRPLIRKLSMAETHFTATKANGPEPTPYNGREGRAKGS